MSAGPVVALVLAKENAIQDWRLLMGPTNPEEAKELYPDSVRALFGKGKKTDHLKISSFFILDNTRNAVHGSDSRISSAREIGFFFPQIRNDQNEGGGANEYLEQYVTPTLNKSLAQLAKEKPKDPLQWLADHLEKNNPNKPDINLY